MRRRQSGADGIYRDLLLYNFADNHDVNRVASNLTNPAHLYTLYGLLFTMPGIPSIYYGSEWGLDGRRTQTSDAALRPALHLPPEHIPHPHLYDAIRRFARVRHTTPALKVGRYEQRYIAHEQFAFERATDEQTVLVLLNASAQEATIPLEGVKHNRFIDVLNQDGFFEAHNGRASIRVPSHWLRILKAI